MASEAPPPPPPPPLGVPPGDASHLEQLPNELFLQILEYLDSSSVTKLFLVSRHFYKLCLDDRIWRARCFDESAFKKTLRLRRHVLHPPSFSATPLTTIVAPSTGVATSSPNHATHGAPSPPLTTAAAAPTVSGHRRWLQDMANWDPVLPGERVSWYDEYIHRHGNTAVNWMQQPRFMPGNEVALFDMIDVRGVALFREDVTRPGPVMAVAPLDDGSVCLWDVNGARGPKGAIIGRSAPGMLLVDGASASINSQRSKRVDTGVAECISVSHQLGLAFVAVQSRASHPGRVASSWADPMLLQISSRLTSTASKSSTTIRFPRQSPASRPQTLACRSRWPRRAACAWSTTEAGSTWHPTWTSA
jgi:hypothetical protein